MPDYPPFPPPAYTLAADVPPGSAFRMPRAPRRRLPAPAPRKQVDAISTASTSAGVALSREDGTRRELARDIEGLGSGVGEVGVAESCAFGR